MKRSTKGLYWVLILIGLIGILDFIFLRFARVGYNLGTVLPLFAGILMVGIGLIKLRTRVVFFKNRLSLRIFSLMMILFVSSFVIVEAFIWASAFEKNDVKPKILILLGAGLRGNEIPATFLFRLEKARDYMIENSESVVVVTGGQGLGETTTEAAAMKKWLVDEGINEDRILEEDKATSTWENVKFSKIILDKTYGEKPHEVMIITSDFHVFRSKLLARRVGLTAYGLAAPTWIGVFPNCCIREYIAVMKSVGFDF